ncbi:Uricase [Adhaeretor mobilis]|uniref:Uricase n=2 Tax=Adhaeretor mobilis TaxID=1930276 RepID=A0A517MQQ9_9BACT|nr:Uricase [Adhaeretor mobilis]
MAGYLKHQCYGKHNVRVSKVRRPRQAASKEEQHEFVELSVNVELEGDFDAAYTDGDNRSIVATDTCKNTVYGVAKNHSIDCPESFALAVAQHFMESYAHVSRCRIAVSERVWKRLLDSPHCFSALDSLKPTAVVIIERGSAPQVTAGFEQLMIAKTTESGFSDFQSGEFRSLADTEDRILASEVSADWVYSNAKADFSKDRQSVVSALLTRFTDHFSRSVQETLYLMAQAALDACADVQSITLSMPNKHHLLADLSAFGLENENEVFCVTDEPFGYIEATIERE